MLTYRKNCKVCQLIKADPKLMKRIYDSSYYIPHSKDSLTQIWKDCNAVKPGSFVYLTLLNHVKKHQHLNAHDYDQKMMKLKAKQAEDKIITAKYEAINVQDAVINVAMEKLENGELKVDVRDLLRAARDKQDAQAKVRDQQLQLAEMVAFFASGEDKVKGDRIHDRRVIALEEYDPSVPIAYDSDSRA